MPSRLRAAAADTSPQIELDSLIYSQLTAWSGFGTLAKSRQFTAASELQAAQHGPASEISVFSDSTESPNPNLGLACPAHHLLKKVVYA